MSRRLHRSSPENRHATKSGGKDQAALSRGDDHRQDDGSDPAAIEAVPPGADDLYLAPHSDDVCFSLGDLARRRRAGTVLTIFSASRYASGPAGRLGTAAEITRIRLAEDAAFAAACGVAAVSLGLEDAPLRGRHPFRLDSVGERAREIETPLLTAIEAQRRRHPDEERPWLFSPAGIGGHVDHVAVMAVVAHHLELLLPYYRVGFYEDLFYAADAVSRSGGLTHLADRTKPHALVRRQWPIDVAQKLRLLHLYPSQFDTLPTAIGDFSPPASLGPGAHEAVWVVDGAAGAG